MAADPKEELARILDQLDAADAALVEALDQRARAVQRYVELRAEEPEGYFTLPREREVVARAKERAAEFPRDGVGWVVREVLSACAELVAPRKVLYVGPETSFTHLAARGHFGAAAQVRSADSVEEVLDGVERGRASFGVVPFETSTEGAFTATLHGLERSDVKICAETTVQTSYHLLSRSGTAADIERVYGAPQAVAACERFMRTHFPRATVVDVPSGDIAARYAEEDAKTAAIGSGIVTELHDLQVVQERIEDNHGVETRFVIVSRDLTPRTGKDRTVLALALHDDPGALYQALQPFAERGLNLTRLESRPSQDSTWRFSFFIELDGHVTDRSLLTALEELRGIIHHVKVLGSYPRPE
jgi:chorismate mutase/prephenate dehydratase